MKLFVKIVFSISLSLVLILLSVQVVTTKPYMRINHNLYERHDEITWDYDFAMDNIVDYLNGKRDNLYFGDSIEMSNILMTERGMEHMVDVKVLYQSGKVILSICAVFVAITGVFLWDRRELWKTLTRLWIFPLVFIGTITISMVIDFSWTFTKFHELLFSNNLWQLSWDDPLLVMLPIPFFFVTAITIVVISVLLHSIAIVLAYKKK